MQIDLPYCDLTMSENVEELRLQLNDYLYRLREAIEIAIEMELASQSTVSEAVTRLELEQLSNQILADANAVVRSSLGNIESTLEEKIEAIKTETEAEIEAFEATIAGRIIAFESSTTETINAFKNDINAEVEAFEDEVNGQIESFTTAVNADIAAFKSEVNTKLSEMEAGMLKNISLNINYETGMLTYELVKGE